MGTFPVAGVLAAFSNYRHCWLQRVRLAPFIVPVTSLLENLVRSKPVCVKSLQMDEVERHSCESVSFSGFSSFIEVSELLLLFNGVIMKCQFVHFPGKGGRCPLRPELHQIISVHISIEWAFFQPVWCVDAIFCYM